MPREPLAFQRSARSQQTAWAGKSRRRPEQPSARRRPFRDLSATLSSPRTDSGTHQNTSHTHPARHQSAHAVAPRTSIGSWALTFSRQAKALRHPMEKALASGDSRSVPGGDALLLDANCNTATATTASGDSLCFDDSKQACGPRAARIGSVMSPV